jgi:hypothetical protein
MSGVLIASDTHPVASFGVGYRLTPDWAPRLH